MTTSELMRIQIAQGNGVPQCQRCSGVLDGGECPECETQFFRCPGCGEAVDTNGSGRCNSEAWADFLCNTCLTADDAVNSEMSETNKNIQGREIETKENEMNAWVFKDDRLVVLGRDFEVVLKRGNPRCLEFEGEGEVNVKIVPSSRRVWFEKGGKREVWFEREGKMWVSYEESQGAPEQLPIKPPLSW